MSIHQSIPNLSLVKYLKRYNSLKLKFYAQFDFQILDVLYATADGFEVPEGEEAVDADEPDEY